jgi:hydrogenase nickel incorporation protein HypA/HybF
MHEMGIALEIVDIATASIPDDLQGAPVARIHLAVGKLAAVVPASLRFCFDVAVKGTALEGAQLVIEEVAVVARCRDCQAEWTIDGPAFSCQKCGSGGIDILSGRELDIQSIEIEDPNEAQP